MATDARRSHGGGFPGAADPAATCPLPGGLPGLYGTALWTALCGATRTGHLVDGSALWEHGGRLPSAKHHLSGRPGAALRYRLRRAVRNPGGSDRRWSGPQGGCNGPWRRTAQSDDRSPQRLRLLLRPSPGAPRALPGAAGASWPSGRESGGSGWHLPLPSPSASGDPGRPGPSSGLQPGAADRGRLGFPGSDRRVQPGFPAGSGGPPPMAVPGRPAGGDLRWTSAE